MTRVVSGFVVVVLGVGIASAQRREPQLMKRFDGAAPMRRVVPDYPSIARSACIQGTVAVLVAFDKSGTVTSTEVVFGPVFLRAAALAAARQWRFERVADENRRQVIHFSFSLVSRQTLREVGPSSLSGPTRVDVRSSPGEVTCLDCDANEQEQAQVKREQECAGP
jgi:TonB family protein